MRGRVLGMTMMIVSVSIVGMLHAKATDVPARAAARSTIQLAPVQRQTQEVSLPFRNIFAPLRVIPAPSTSPVKTEVVAAPAETAPVLRLAAMVDDVVFQETAASYTTGEKEHYDVLLAKAFSKFPTEFTEPLNRLTLKKSRTGSRGLSGAHIMILRTLGMSDEELVAVAIHELGHIIDMGALQGTSRSGWSGFMDGPSKVWSDDLSVNFYQISWLSDTQKRTANAADFVSGYAMTDPFEDFSETFTMYVLHGERFRKLTRRNVALEKKYAFMRDVLFEGREFRGIDAISYRTDSEERPWDVTVQPYSWPAFQQAVFY